MSEQINDLIGATVAATLHTGAGIGLVLIDPAGNVWHSLRLRADGPPVPELVRLTPDGGKYVRIAVDWEVKSFPSVPLPEPDNLPAPPPPLVLAAPAKIVKRKGPRKGAWCHEYTCAGCGTVFTPKAAPKYPDRAYCSRSCTGRAHCAIARAALLRQRQSVPSPQGPAATLEQEERPSAVGTKSEPSSLMLATEPARADDVIHEVEERIAGPSVLENALSPRRGAPPETPVETGVADETCLPYPCAHGGACTACW